MKSVKYDLVFMIPGEIEILEYEIYTLFLANGDTAIGFYDTLIAIRSGIIFQWNQ